MTRNWLKAAYAAIALIAVIIVTALMLAPKAAAIPECAHEDGSTQRVCIFHGSDGTDYLNSNYGESYVTLRK